MQKTHNIITYPFSKDDPVLTSKMVYKGEWKDDMRNGHGKQEYYDGSIFEGDWLDNRQSFGSYTWPDGTQYSG